MGCDLKKNLFQHLQGKCFFFSKMSISGSSDEKKRVFLNSITRQHFEKLNIAMAFVLLFSKNDHKMANKEKTNKNAISNNRLENATKNPTKKTTKNYENEMTKNTQVDI